MAPKKTLNSKSLEAIVSSMACSRILTNKEALELVRAYHTIPENQRRGLFDLARVLSAAR